MAEPKILMLTGQSRLSNARVLGEFEAMVVDPRFAALFGYSEALEPGTKVGAENASTARVPADELEKRKKELRPFFDLGGVAVVYGYAETVLVAREGRMYTERREVTASTHDWLFEHLKPPPRRLKPGERIPFASDEPAEPWLRAAHGEHIRVVEPGHALAPYLEKVGHYEAIFAAYVREWSNATILAENRAAEPVAVEFACGRGSVVIAPPPADSDERSVLLATVRQLLHERVSVSREWRLASEQQLEAEEQATALRHREERRALADRRAQLREVKALVFEDVIVKRVVGYWDRATAPGATHEQALQQLYKLIEVLEDRYGGERGLPDALMVDRTKLKAVKRLANNYDIRHAGAGSEALPLLTFNEALDFGRHLVQAFLERRADEVVAAAAEK